MIFYKSPIVFLVVAFSLVTGFLQAMLPDHVYSDRIAGSKIQAIAVVKTIEEIRQPDEGKASEIGKASENGKASDNYEDLLLKVPAPSFRSKTYSSKQAVFIIEKLIKLESSSDDEPNGLSPVPMISISSVNSVDSEKKPLELSEGSEVTGIFHVPIVQTTDDPLFFDPKVGERVFVTISSEQGEITSYTILDSDLENALKSSPDAVGIGTGKIFLRR